MAWRRGQSYSQDLRERVLAAVDGGMAVREVVALFQVSISFIDKALIRRRRTGDVGPNRNRGHRGRKLTPKQEAALTERIRQEPDITLARLQDWLVDDHGVRLSNGAIWMAVRRLGFSFKKKPGGQRARPSGCGRAQGWVERRPAVH